MTFDYLSIIADESSRIVSAYELDRRAAVPWSDRWKVATVARHVAATHHVVAGIVSGRPDAHFGLFGELQMPPKDSPEFVDWSRSGTTSLLEQLATVPADDECWSWFDRLAGLMERLSRHSRPRVSGRPFLALYDPA